MSVFYVLLELMEWMMVLCLLMVMMVWLLSVVLSNRLCVVVGSEMVVVCVWVLSVRNRIRYDVLSVRCWVKCVRSWLGVLG